MSTDKEREAFERWFFASKYAQVVNPSSSDIRLAWDAWQAARCGQDAMRDALTLIRDLPIAEQDTMLSANMRKIARAALAAHPAPEATNWKAAYEQEAQKFRAETLHTSDLHQMLLKWMKLSADRYGCTADTWVKPCVQCDLMRETKAVLERPINTQPEPRASQDAAIAQQGEKL